jgi:hypothetical protein
MRPERPSGASGYAQAQENSTEHPRAGRTCAESVGDDTHAGGTGAGTCTCTDDHASARAFSYARARTDDHADAGCGRHACEPDALT